MRTFFSASVLALATLGFAQSPVAPTRAAAPHQAIADLGMGLRVLATDELDLGQRCATIRDGTGNPMLVWAYAEGGALTVAKDRGAVEAWLATHAAALGQTGFTPAFARAGVWRGCDGWTFEFSRDGAPLFDSDVTLYFDGDRCVGLFNRMPRASSVDPTVRAGDGASIWYGRRDGSGAIVRARLVQSLTPTHRVTEVVDAGRVVHRMFEQREWTVAPQQAAMTEYTFPGMSFPDQIWADSKGLIWFSEPTPGRISVFNPNTNQFRSYPTTGWSSPDGFVVDDQDRAWFGLYASGHGLGKLDIPTGVFTRYAPPYSPANMAIPTPSGYGTLWVTDHSNEKVSEFDPKTSTWLRTISLPASTYPVGIHLESETNTAWSPLYIFQGLGKLPPGAPTMQRIAAPSQNGPAFGGVNDGKVYFTYWTANKLGVYDTKTNTFAEYLWRAGENGGPMFMAPNGHAVIGTRSRGYIAVFNPVTRTFTDYLIPTTSPGLKDGLTVAPDGVIWFTQSSANKIAKLVLP